MVSLAYPTMNFCTWGVTDGRPPLSVLTVSPTQYVILRWDFHAYAGRQVVAPGILEMSVHSFHRLSSYPLEEFGRIRVAEIIGGTRIWQRETITWAGFSGGGSEDEVFNPQMIVDEDLGNVKDGKHRITISRPVLQRLIDDYSFGLALRPLGPVIASYCALEAGGAACAPRLGFTTGL